MYCLLCRKHNTKNEQNKSKVFSSDPAVRYRKPTITSHADSRQHLAAIEAEHLQRVSTFHKESVNRENVADDVLYKALMSVYWIAKHEIPIRKLVPLLQLLEKVGVTEMKYFTHRSAGSVHLGRSFLNSCLRKYTGQILLVFCVTMSAILQHLSSLSASFSLLTLILEKFARTFTLLRMHWPTASQQMPRPCLPF